MDPKALVHGIFDELVNQRRMDKFDDYFAEDYVDHGPGGDTDRDATRGLFNAWLGAFSELHCEVTNLITEGDTVAWVVHTTGVHTGDTLGFPATGKRIETLAANIGRLRDGRAVEHWSEQGMLATLQQLGIIPAMGPPAPVS